MKYAIEEDDILRIVPVYIKKMSENYLVIKKEDMTVLTTPKAGAMVVELIASKKPPSKIKEIVSKKFGVDLATVNITPIIETLIDNGFISRIGNHVVFEENPRWFVHLTYFMSVILRVSLFEFLIKRNRIQVTYPFLKRMFFRKMQVDEKLLHHACVAFGKSGLSDSRFSRNYENIQKQIAFDKTLFFRLNYDALGRWIRNYFVLENQISVIEETKDKGVIFCGYHFGSFETLPIVFGNIGIEVCSPVAYKDEYFEQHVKRIEVVKGRVFPVVPRLYSRSEKDGLILYRALREGKSILLFCDTHILLTENYLTVQLMGRSIKVNRGAAALHKKTHVPIVPVLTYQKRNQCHIRFLSPITYKQEITEHEITQRLFRILEDHVRDYPSQWAKWHDWENMVTQLG